MGGREERTRELKKKKTSSHPSPRPASPSASPALDPAPAALHIRGSRTFWAFSAGPGAGLSRHSGLDGSLKAPVKWPGVDGGEQLASSVHEAPP